MSSIFGNLEVAKRALSAHQAALNTIGHNLANAATPGYSRQRAELVPVGPGNGVAVSTISRLGDRALALQVLAETQGLGKAEAQTSLLQRLEAILNDLSGSGLGSVLDQLFQGFQDLSVRPTDTALRVAVQNLGDRLAATLRGLQSRVDQLEADLTTEIQDKVAEANRLLPEIAELNRQIVASGGGAAANDLLDRRDRLVTELSRIIGVTATDQASGSVHLAVTGTGVLLVDGTLAVPLTATVNVAGDTVDLTANGAAITPSSGALAALVQARNSATGPVKQTVSDLDSLARSIIAEVNRLHASGSGLSGHASLTATNAVTSAAAPLTAAGLAFPPVTGSFRVIVHDATGAVLSSTAVPVTAGVTTLNDIQAAIGAIPSLTATITDGALTVSAAAGTTFTFAADTSDTLLALGLNTFFTGSDATTMALAPLVAGDASKIAGARADAAGLVHPGDGSNALDLARLRTKLTMSTGTETFGGFYVNAVSGVGSQARAALATLDRQQAQLQLVEALQQQISGVSPDDEMVSLSQSENAYAAAARYVAVMNDVMETLLGML